MLFRLNGSTTTEPTVSFRWVAIWVRMTGTSPTSSNNGYRFKSASGTGSQTASSKATLNEADPWGTVTAGVHKGIPPRSIS